MKISGRKDVTTVAAGVCRALLQENGLDLRSKELEIKSVGCGGRRRHLRARLGALADPFGKQFPFRIALRSPELATRMSRIASGLLRQRMKQQAAFQRVGGRDQLRNNLEVSARLFRGPGRTSR